MSNSKNQFIIGYPEGFGEYPAMPLHKVHLIAGGSGAGKTTLLMQLIDAMQKGEEFLGYPTQFHPFIYCAFDRAEDESEDTMERSGVDPSKIPFLSLPMLDKPRSFLDPDTRFERIMSLIRAKAPDARVVIIDGFMLLVPYGAINDYLTVACFLAKVRKYCEDFDLTIIGLVHSTKQKQGQKIIDPRQQVIGSVAAAGFSSCNILVERVNPDVDDEKRTVWVLPRNLPDLRLAMCVDDKGRIVPDIKTDADREFALENWFCAQGSRDIPTTEICEYMAEFKVCRPHVYRYLNKLVKSNRLTRTGRGLYRLNSQKQAAAQEIPFA